MDGNEGRLEGPLMDYSILSSMLPSSCLSFHTILPCTSLPSPTTSQPVLYQLQRCSRTAVHAFLVGEHSPLSFHVGVLGPWEQAQGDELGLESWAQPLHWLSPGSSALLLLAIQA
jgi:hypothetical protein